MSYDLAPDHLAARERAREFAADQLSDAAAGIDRSGAIPAALAREAARLAAVDDPVAVVVILEELAAVSAAVAASAGLGQKSGGPGAGLSGLRGLAAVEQGSDQAQLALAAVALGIGRAAVEIALDAVRDAGTASDGREEKPHWVVSDVATELEAARLLALQAAQALTAGEAATPIAMARLLATSAAHHAVDAALRIAGAGALREGSHLERLSRDVRAVALLLGSEEDHRAAAAEGLLPAGR